MYIYQNREVELVACRKNKSWIVIKNLIDESDIDKLVDRNEVKTLDYAMVEYNIWKINQDCGHLSNLNKFKEHRNYKLLLTFGTNLIPFLVSMLEKEPDWIPCLLLSDITGAKPKMRFPGVFHEVVKDYIEYFK